MKKGILTIVSGFAGAGKGTIVNRLVSEYDNYALSVSMTTRKPRPGEQDGVHYFFISKEEFEKNIKENKMLEYAQYVDNYYGTPKEYVENKLNAGQDVILEIEYLGAFQVKKMMPDALMLFVTPPSAEILYNRLKGRGTETDEVIAKRMLRASTEADIIDKYDYIIVNDDIDLSVKETHEIIQNAKSSTGRNKDFINEIKLGLEKYQAI